MKTWETKWKRERKTQSKNSKQKSCRENPEPRRRETQETSYGNNTKPRRKKATHGGETIILKRERNFSVV